MEQVFKCRCYQVQMDKYSGMITGKRCLKEELLYADRRGPTSQVWRKQLNQNEYSELENIQKNPNTPSKFYRSNFQHFYSPAHEGKNNKKFRVRLKRTRVKRRHNMVFERLHHAPLGLNSCFLWGKRTVDERHERKTNGKVDRVSVFSWVILPLRCFKPDFLRQRILTNKPISLHLRGTLLHTA